MNLSPRSISAFIEKGMKKRGLLNCFLSFGSLFFYVGVKAKNFLYDKKILRGKKCDAFVVSVGNIVAGGTGKTPLTLLLAKELLPFLKVAIVSRGYKGKAEKMREPLVVSCGKGPLHPPAIAGDEPYLLANNLSGVIVIAGKDRVKGANLAKKMGADVVILDDGMQHRRLHRDFDIVLVNGHDPFGGGHFLPRGYLRDERRRIATSSLVVYAEKGEGIVISEKITVSQPIENKRVGLFCGLARPERFVKSVEGLKGDIKATYFLKDHEKMKRGELERFAKMAKKLGAEVLVCSEKDFVKLGSCDELVLPLVWVKKEVRITKNQEQFQDAIDRIKKGSRL